MLLQRLYFSIQSSPESTRIKDTIIEKNLDFILEHLIGPLFPNELVKETESVVSGQPVGVIKQSDLKSKFINVAKHVLKVSSKDG